MNFAFVSFTHINSLFSGCFCISKAGQKFCHARRYYKEKLGCARKRRCLASNCCVTNTTDPQNAQPPSSSCFGKGTIVDIKRASLTDFEKLGVQVDRNWRFLLPGRKNEVVLSTVIASVTLTLIGQPMIGADTTGTWLVIGVFLGIWSLDNVAFSGNITSFCSGVFQNRQRVAVHEAGHFLTAYLLGIRIQSYSIDSWTALRQGRASSGVLFNQEDVLKLSKYSYSQIALIWLAGIAAEVLVFGVAEGGLSDVEQVKLLLKLDKVQDVDQYIKRVLYQAMECIHRHFDAFESLRNAMWRNESLEKCFFEIEKNVRLDSTLLEMTVGNSNQ